jgi:hypothetical protein
MVRISQAAPCQNEPHPIVSRRFLPGSSELCLRFQQTFADEVSNQQRGALDSNRFVDATAMKLDGLRRYIESIGDFAAGQPVCHQQCNFKLPLSELHARIRMSTLRAGRRSSKVGLAKCHVLMLCQTRRNRGDTGAPPANVFVNIDSSLEGKPRAFIPSPGGPPGSAGFSYRSIAARIFGEFQKVRTFRRCSCVERLVQSPAQPVLSSGSPKHSSGRSGFLFQEGHQTIQDARRRSNSYRRTRMD